MSKKVTDSARILIPSLDRMDVRNARFILSMRLSADIIRRVDELGTIGEQRDLNEDERRELEFYLNLGSMLTIMHSKARMAIRKSDGRGARRKSA